MSEQAPHDETTEKVLQWFINKATKQLLDQLKDKAIKEKKDFIQVIVAEALEMRGENAHLLVSEKERAYTKTLLFSYLYGASSSKIREIFSLARGKKT